MCLRYRGLTVLDSPILFFLLFHQDVLDYYQERGHFLELIELMDTGLTLERATPAMFTELGILLTKYKEDAMMDFVKMWWQRANLSRLARACEQAQMWSEMVYLHTMHKEYDQAASVMISHAPSAWSPSAFTEVMTKATNLDVMTRGMPPKTVRVMRAKRKGKK